MPSNRGPFARTMLLVAAWAAVGTLSTGCDAEPSASVPRPSGTLLANDQSAAAMLENALLLLEEQRGEKRDRQVDPLQARRDNEATQARLRGLLNQWLIRGELGDSLVLPERTEHVLRGFVERGHLRPEHLEDIRRKSFTPSDAQHIQACMYLAEITRYARGSEPDELTRARLLFDWVVRNVQLVAPDDAQRTGMLKLLGPVFHSPLLIGKGTELERAWIYVLLLRQLRIQACYVGRRAPEGAFEPRWVAVLIGGELYLFDPKMGLPLPSDDHGVATLEELAADPHAVLGRLGNGGEPIPEPKQIVLRLDADTAFWAPRMKLLESHMTGLAQPVVLYEEVGRANQTPLPNGTDDLLDRLRDAAGELRKPFFANEPIGLLDVPERLRSESAPLERGDPPAVFEAFLFGGGYLGEARQLQLRGRWDEAVRTYQIVLKLHAEITSDPLHEYREGFFASLARETATYWIGLCKYEQGEFESAAGNWLRPYLQRYPEGEQIHGARYLLARCLEKQADQAPPEDPAARRHVEEAVEHFENSTSPQRWGDRVRARRLQERLQ